jgi:hypothetical protein
MKTLIENLYDNNVIFSYYGFIDEPVLNQILQITSNKLATIKELPDVIKRVSDAIYECGINIINHNFYPDEAKVKYKSLLVISIHENNYLIDTINFVNDTQKESINEQIKYLQNCSPEELKELKDKGPVPNLNHISVSSGLLDLVLKADGWDCTFKEINGSLLFNINYVINCNNN